MGNHFFRVDYMDLIFEKLMHFLAHLNPIAYSILWTLLIMSILTWYLLLSKSLQLISIYWRSRQIKKLFWQPSSFTPLLTHLTHHSPTHPFAKLALHSINATLLYERRKTAPLITSHSEFLQRHIQQVIQHTQIHLESGLIILATISSTAPFIGLLGTVLSIYEALMNISHQSDASLATIAAPVGEALIMTALGLTVAIPAVLSYNFLLRANRTFMLHLHEFAQSLHSCLNSGARMNPNDHSHIAHIYNHIPNKGQN